jgi:hypothetical protein
MPIVPTQETQHPETSIVSLAAYARHIKACECGFYGVVNGPECTYSGGCQTLWSKEQRDWVQYYLAEAQHEIEETIHYFIGRRWVVDEEHAYARRILTNWGYVVSGGVETEAVIASGEAVDHTGDPAIIGPVATTVTDASEIHVYHPGSDIEIIPSSIEISGGQVTVEVPRCRMVKPALVDNSTSGLEYTDTSNFSATVDLKRTYNVDDNPASLVYKLCQSRTSCTDTEAEACLYVRKPKVGSVEVRSDCATVCGTLYKAKLSYYAGRQMVDANGYFTRWGRQAFTAIIRLAHAKMPHAPCDCEAADEMWARDREVIVDGFGRPRRGVSPFGPEEGAWAAYNFANAPGMELVRGATL